MGPLCGLRQGQNDSLTINNYNHIPAHVPMPFYSQTCNVIFMYTTLRKQSKQNIIQNKYFLYFEIILSWPVKNLEKREIIEWT